MRKILVVRNDRFGEFLLNIPAMRAVKETYPAAQLHVAVAAGVAELARAVPLIDRVIVFPAQESSWLDRCAAVLRYRREKYDAAAVLNPTALAHQLLFWSGIPRRVGYSRKHPFFLTHTLEDVKGLGRQHEVENNLELISLLGCSTKDRSLALCVPADVQEHVARKWNLDPSARYVAVHPWTSDPVKQWPLERFEKLVLRLVKDQSRKAVILGRPESWHQPVAFPALPGIIDLAGRTTLLEAAAVLKSCAVLVSGDSGPVHLAASVGTPVVALFRNDMPGKNPERWGPWPSCQLASGASWQRGAGSGQPGPKHSVIQNSSLENITVDEVCRAVAAMPVTGERGA